MFILSNIFTGVAVERDGQIIISGRGPEAAEEFGNAVVYAMEG